MTATVANDSSLSLLVVEDDDGERSLLADALALRFPELTILQAADGNAGWQLCREHAPEIVLADICMPVLDGISMSRRILAEFPNTHIAIISGNSDTTHLLEAIRLGIRQYLLKPLNYDSVFQGIAEWLERLHLERQVTRQNEQIRKLWRGIEQSPAVILTTDVAGNVECVNRRFAELTGRSETEVLGRHLEALFDSLPEGLARLVEMTGPRPAQPAEHAVAAFYECAVRRRQGESIPCLVSAAPAFDPDGSFRGTSVVFTDISSRKKLLDETVRAQKLESLSVLAGGIAHDFNNVLTGILGNISCAQALAPPHHPIRSPLFDAEEASQRAAQLARQLLAFARGGKPVKKRVLLRNLLEESVTSALSGSGIGAVVKAGDNIGLEVDDRLVQQAFANILTNAAQAMPAGGTVTVEATGVHLGADNLIGVSPGHYVRITFSDAGCGIPQEVLDKIFDPYFSTKPGCPGLGLSSAYSIVVNHGGHIGARSWVGKGTAVVCHLPAGASGPVPQPAPAPRPLPAAPTGAPVLIMDDEKIVRKVAGKMLESLGYQVTTCTCGEQAVELYREAKLAGAPFLTVLMDLTIPGGMGGKEAAREILALDPQARLVVSSGYFDDPVMSDFKEYGFWAVMPKPYKLSDVEDLMERLAEPDGVSAGSGLEACA
ncbi:response regulator [Geomesophilobacter sediminis]|uniref:histidine kinase n=1 Tax=Geomesophilobacter sediminis TaxID=2798584 RepID=A0A8J7JE82_9BACT|nr:response regulator [Geomesophilobacter sediminis]MBJ6725798.1 response regulator [Geomesophilobacter sediminis]